MKTVFKYLLAGFLVISVIGIGIIQIIQIVDTNNLKQTVRDLKTQFETWQNNGITSGPTSFPILLDTTIPTLTTNPVQTMTVRLYYKNYNLDPNVNNCEADTYVERTIAKTTTPLTDTIKLLLTNNLTTAEKNLGLESEFNTTVASTKLTLTSATITNGKATLTFSDPSNFSSGGSCRSGILASQIALTAKQFQTVTTVEIKPDNVFQP